MFTSRFKMYYRGYQNGTVLTQSLSQNGDDLCSHLSEELIVEILLRLPVRSLLQFKCICKLWKTLISDSKFVKRHLQITSAEPSLIHQRLFFFHLSEPYKILYYHLKPLLENRIPPVRSSGVMKSQYKIIGSCNGLLCLYNRTRNCVKLHNPSIRFKSKKSPKAISLAWILGQHGFGYDQVNDKYKALLVMQSNKHPSKTLTKIYTFGNDSWKTIQNFNLTPDMSSRLLGEFVSGTLNWIVYGFSSNKSSILSFDMEKETYNEMLLPQDDDVKVFEHTLYVLNNFLGVCYESNQNHWVGWLMKEYGVVESWTKIMFIPYDKFNKQPGFPLFISENGVVLLMNNCNSQLVLYNINNGQFINSLESTSNTLMFNLQICCESLVSVPW